MSEQADERHRRSIRLKGYDYSQAGMYFVTVCAYNKKCVFGEIESGVMRLNTNGEIVASEWVRSPSRNLGAMVRGFKGAASRRINAIRNIPGAAVWQRNYYEHVIRNDDDYHRIAEYVANNPQRWMEDSLHPEFIVGAYANTPEFHSPRIEGSL